MANSKNKRRLLIVLALSASLFAGCSKELPKDSKVVAVVNGEKIYRSDFKKELALRVRQNPAFSVNSNTLNELLNSLIDRKLIIQEAVRERLSEKDRFVETIRNFWEQTLIRDFIEYRNNQTGKTVYATEDEVKDYYKKMGELTTFEVIKRPDRLEVESLMKRAKSGEEIEWDMKVPLRYDEIPSDTFLSAFDMPLGDMGIYKEGSTFYLIHVLDKEPIKMPAIDEIYGDIEERIKQRKEALGFKAWLEKRRGDSKIEILDNNIAGVK